MQTANKYIRTGIPVILMGVLGILSTAAPDPTLKILFLVCGACAIILCFYGDLINKSGTRKVLLCVNGSVFVAIFLWSVFSAGSLAAYGTRLLSFFQPKFLDSSVDEVYQELNSETVHIEQEISNTDAAVAQILDELEDSRGSLREYQFFSGRYDPEEVEQIAAVIRENLEKDAEEEKPNFAEIKTDKHVVELFYKMRLSRQFCQYINCIKALESTGIDCVTMSIDEYTLMRWDTECMFATYSMRQDRLNDAAQGKIYDETQRFYYQDYKIVLDQYSDMFDYDNWRKEFDPDSAENIVLKLNNNFMDFYQKLHMNFQKTLS